MDNIKERVQTSITESNYELPAVSLMKRLDELADAGLIENSDANALREIIKALRGQLYKSMRKELEQIAQAYEDGAKIGDLNGMTYAVTKFNIDYI